MRGINRQVSFLSSLFSLAFALTLLLFLAAPAAFAAPRSLAVASRNVSTTGVFEGLGGIGGGPPALAPPGSVRITARRLCTGAFPPPPCTSADGSSAAQISWYDISTDDVRTHLERRLEPSGAWTRVQTIAQPVTHAFSVFDLNLAPDSRYCYRLTAEASNGDAQTSSSACVVTQQRGDLPVTRAQLRLVVANVANAGTDGQFTVGLNEGPFNLPNGNFTAINTPRDDLEAGSDVLYELNVLGIASFRDVTRIVVGSSSTDALCLEEVQLILNGNENNGKTPDAGGVVYERFYGSTATTCRWVGGIYGALVVDHAALRAAPEFATFDGGEEIFSLGKLEIEARLEPIIGTLFYERRDIDWDRDETSAVSVSTAEGGQSLRVHMDLEGITGGPNPEVDVDFLLTPRFTATASPSVWNLELDTHDLTASVDFSWWVEVLSGLLDPICSPIVAVAQGRDPFLDCISHLEDYIETQIEASFDAPSESMTVRLPAGCIEPSISVASDTSIRFGCNAYKRTTTTPFVRSIGSVGTTLSR